jgi:hypothetical protein
VFEEPRKLANGVLVVQVSPQRHLDEIVTQRCGQERPWACAEDVLTHKRLRRGIGQARTLVADMGLPHGILTHLLTSKTASFCFFNSV